MNFMNLNNKQKKSLVTYLFVAILLLIFNLNFSLELGAISVSFPITGIASAIILIVATSKYKNENPALKKLFIASIALLSGIVAAPFVSGLVMSSAIPQMDEIMRLALQLETQTNVDFSILGQILEIFSSLKWIVFGSLFVSLGLSTLPTCIVIYYVGQVALIIAQSVYSTIGEECLSYSKKTACFSLITTGLTALFMLPVFSLIDSIKFIGDQIQISDNIASLGGWVLILSILLLVASIIYLVYHIKLCIRLYKLSSANELNQPDQNVIDMGE